jgi:hypothetical protein
MLSRREVLRGGLGVFALGAAGSAFGFGSRAGVRVIETPLKATRPLLTRHFDAKPRVIDGFRFLNWFEGDDFNDGLNIPFHSAENDFPGGSPPEPSERVRVAVVGGGISGLASGYLLRQYDPVVFELHPLFGGNAQGGVIDGSAYSLGSAYVITPDEGGDLDTIYRDLGLDRVVRPDVLPAPVEINGKINPDVWAGIGATEEDLPAYEAYRQLVIRMTDEYPDVPFAEPWMIELDKISLKEHIEREVVLAIPAPLRAAIQAYCYSSFNAGWEEVSAASGWNFLAAEEFGRWVFPGGNAWMADALWQRLLESDGRDVEHAPHLRADSRVVDVRVRADGLTQVTWRTPEGKFRSLLADRVVMACPKHVCRKVLYGLEKDDPARFNAMVLHTRPYVMANVVVDRPIPLEFYDIFLLGDPERFPRSPGEARDFWRYTDVLDGSYTPMPGHGRLPAGPSVLSMYWPLPYDTARFDLVLGDPIDLFGAACARQLRETLPLVGLPESSVREIRFTRWGHAMPVARVGFIASGQPGLIMSPYKGSIYFVNQDNWALPAVENSLLDAINATSEIAAFLG